MIHMAHMLLAAVHVRHTYAFRRQSLYMATFHAKPTDFDGPYCSQEKGLLTQSQAHQLTDPQVLHPISLP
jgi:hypothetical protein